MNNNNIEIFVEELINLINKHNIRLSWDYAQRKLTIEDNQSGIYARVDIDKLNKEDISI